MSTQKEKQDYITMKQQNETFEAEITKVKKQKNELEAREKGF